MPHKSCPLVSIFSCFPIPCQTGLRLMGRFKIVIIATGCYWWKIVYFLSIQKYINGNTMRQCGLCYELPKRYIYRLRGPIQFSSAWSWRGLQPQKPYFTNELRCPNVWIVPCTKMTYTVPFLLNESSKIQIFNDLLYHFCQRLLRPADVTFLKIKNVYQQIYYLRILKLLWKKILHTCKAY